MLFYCLNKSYSLDGYERGYSHKAITVNAFHNASSDTSKVALFNAHICSSIFCTLLRRSRLKLCCCIFQ
jgi:hypothetical protein